MTSLPLFALIAPAPRPAERPAPARPASGPVLINDCVAPADGTTLLLALWRRWDQPPED